MLPQDKALRIGGSTGLAFGLIHASIECLFLGWYGLRLTPTDLVLQGLIFAVLGAVAGAFAAFTLGSIFKRTSVEISVLAATALAYLAILGKIVLDQRGFGPALAVSLVLLALTVIVVGIAHHRRDRPLTLVFAFLAISTVYCAVQLGTSHLGYTAAENVSAVTRQLALAALGALVVFLVVARKAPHPSNGPGPWFAVGAILAVSCLAWMTILPLPTRWTVHQQDDLVLGDESAGRPNVLLIVLDTVRADHLDLFGYERVTMPHLSDLVKRDFAFSTPITATSPWTLPSHASMFTGLYAHEHGAHRSSVAESQPVDSHPLRPDAITAAEYLGDLGYRTGGIAANFAILGQYGVGRGFRYYDPTPGTSFLANRLSWLFRFEVMGRALGNFISRRLPASLQKRTAFFKSYSPPSRRASEIVDEATKWLSGAHRQPYFLFLNFLDAHLPHFPLEPYDERFAPRPRDITWIGEPDQFYEYLHGRATFSPEEIAYIKGQYDAELLGLDESLARLFDHLQASGLYENTFVIITSDHGEEILEHGFLGHGFSLYEPVLSVPLLVKMPRGITPPALASASSMQFVDFLPTISALVQGPPLPKLHGTAWGVGRDYRLSEAYCRACMPSSGAQDIERLRRDLASIRFGETKILLSTGGPAVEAFDLSKDPAEETDVSSELGSQVERARQLLGARSYYIPERLSNSDTDPETLRKLKSLGYVQ